MSKHAQACTLAMLRLALKRRMGSTAKGDPESLACVYSRVALASHAWKLGGIPTTPLKLPEIFGSP